MTNTIDQLVSANRTAKAKIKHLELKRKYLTKDGLKELKEWRALQRRLEKELKQRIVQLPLL